MATVKIKRLPSENMFRERYEAVIAYPYYSKFETNSTKTYVRIGKVSAVIITITRSTGVTGNIKMKTVIHANDASRIVGKRGHKLFLEENASTAVEFLSAFDEFIRESQAILNGGRDE